MDFVDVLNVANFIAETSLNVIQAFEDSNSDTWTPILDLAQGYLKVFDLPCNDAGVDSEKGGASIICKLDYQSGPGKAVKPALENLTPQKPHTIRVYVEEGLSKTHINFSQENEYAEHLASLSEEFQHEYDQFGASSFTRFSSQWTDRPKWWSTVSYGMISDLWKSYTAPSDQDWHYKDALSFFAGLMRCTRRIRTLKCNGERTIVFISCKSEKIFLEEIFKGSYRHRVSDLLARPSTQNVFQQLDAFCEELATGFPHSFESEEQGLKLQTTFLKLYDTNLRQLSIFLDILTIYASCRAKVSDPRRAALTSPSLQGITTDAYLYDQVSNYISEMTTTMESFLSILSIRHPNDQNLKLTATELRAISTSLQNKSSQLSERISFDLRFHELNRAMRESLSVWLLSLLASIFLPLSLAAALLSMQVRLAELHFLLYDFFGLIFILGTIVILIVIALKVYARISDKLSIANSNSFFRRFVNPYMRRAVIWVSGIAWCLVTASFLVGMIKDVGLGLRILGYGLAGMAGLGLMIGGSIGSIALLFYISDKIGNRKARRQN